MGLSLSVEVVVPDGITEQDLIAVGKKYAPAEWQDGMELDDALEWAFSEPKGLAELSQLGITWNTIRNGRIIK